MAYRKSDRLAIALSCLAGIMAIVLFLMEKTPRTAIGLLLAMALLLIYPALHFFRNTAARTAVIVIGLSVTVAFGWSVWPKKPAEHKSDNSAPKPQAATANRETANTSIAASSQNLTTETIGAKDSTRVEVHRPTKDSVTATVKRGASKHEAKGEHQGQEQPIHAPPPAQPTYSVTNPVGSIINQDSTVTGTQNVFNGPRAVIQSLLIKSEITCDVKHGAKPPDHEANFMSIYGPHAELKNSSRTMVFDLVLGSPTADPIENNAAVIVSEVFTISPAEGMIGRPISDLLAFDSISIWPADWGDFWCGHVRTFVGSIYLNGVEIGKGPMGASYDIPEGKRLSSFMQTATHVNMKYGIDSYLHGLQ